jgi:hypothetical protein
VLHRDVKPANILVGPNGRVVLTDFGIARAVDSPTLTGSGALVGSPSYIAPERARGGQSSPAGDLWGLGASLYAAVEGHPPFERNAPLATLTAVVIDEPDEAVHAGPLWPVISGLLRKEPDERLDGAETERMLRGIADDNEATRATLTSQSELPAAAPAGLAPAAEQDAAESAIVEPSVTSSTVAEPATAGSAARPGADSAVTAATPAPAVSEDTAGAPSEPGAVAPPELAGSSSPGAVETPVSAPAAAPPFSGPPLTAAPSARTPYRRPRRPRRPALALAALAMVAVAATAVAVALTSSQGHPAASSGTSSHPARHPGTPTLGASVTPSAAAPGGRTSASPAASSAPASPSSPAHATVSAPAPSGSGSSGGASSGGSAGYGVLAAGYYRFTNSTGFSIGVPSGWQISHVGHYVYITDPSNAGIFLLIDQSDTPNPNPLADWEQQAANRASTYPDYHLIRLESVYYPQAEKAADWEFTYVRSGVLVHILNRNVLANAQHAYALYWSTPESDWNADYHYFQAFAGTFRPAQ